MIAHWNEVEDFRAAMGQIAGRWQDLGVAVGSRRVGLKRIRVEAGRWSTPVHRHGAEEEIHYILSGEGISLQDDRACAVGPGDCLVHRPGREAHSLRAGAEGLEVLAFGTRAPVEAGELPRAGVAWLGETWVEVGAGDHPWAREVAAGEPEVPEPGERPANVVAVAAAPAFFGGRVRRVGDAAGAQVTGLNHATIPAGKIGAPPHCHSLEEEIFVVLEGSGALQLTPSPAQSDRGKQPESHDVRPGTIVSRPGGTGIAHNLRAGSEGIVYLAYGTQEPNDITYYPRSRKLFLRGIGVIGRIEHVPYMEGEEADE